MGGSEKWRVLIRRMGGSSCVGDGQRCAVETAYVACESFSGGGTGKATAAGGSFGFGRGIRTPTPTASSGGSDSLRCIQASMFDLAAFKSSITFETSIAVSYQNRRSAMLVPWTALRFGPPTGTSAIPASGYRKVAIGVSPSIRCVRRTALS